MINNNESEVGDLCTQNKSGSYRKSRILGVCFDRIERGLKIPNAMIKANYYVYQIGAKKGAKI